MSMATFPLCSPLTLCFSFVLSITSLLSHYLFFLSLSLILFFFLFFFVFLCLFLSLLLTHCFNLSLILSFFYSCSLFHSFFFLGFYFPVSFITLCRCFLNFIADMYIAPLKWDYSEALPTPARPNNVVLSCWRNFWENTLGSDRRANVRPFHTKGPTPEKARLFMVEVRANGTWRRPCSAERRWRVLRAVREGKQRSYTVGRGLTYIREYQTRTATLNSMRCLRGSQWRTSHI